MKPKPKKFLLNLCLAIILCVCVFNLLQAQTLTFKAPKAVIIGSLVRKIPVTSTRLYARKSLAYNNAKIIAYKWQKITGPNTVKMSGVTSENVYISMGLGTYVFQLTVTDSRGLKSYTRATVQQLTENKKPIAIIKGVTNLDDAKNSTKLYAHSSYDKDGTIEKYMWKKLSGPVEGVVAGLTSPTLSLSKLKAGKYVYQLTVTDNSGATSATKTSIVLAAATSTTTTNNGGPTDGPRIIVTGLMTLTLPSNTTKLDASGTYDQSGASLTSFSWKYLSGPSQYTLIGATTPILTLDNLTEGNYTFQITIKDSKGYVRSQQAYVKVNPILPGAVECGCTKVLDQGTSESIYLDGNRINAKPGDVICIKSGHYRFINLKNFDGTKDKPIIFKNCGGEVLVTGYTAYGIIISNSNYYKFTGTGSSNYKYGFRITTAVPGQYQAGPLVLGYLSSDFEVDHIDGSWGGVGVFCKTQVTCDSLTWGNSYTMRNVKLHDLYMHNTRGEGYYIGYAAYFQTVTCGGVVHTVPTQKIENLEIYNCIADHTGWDGIQTASIPKQCSVHDNIVTNYGLQNLATQQFGIIFGGNCSGSVYNNIVENGTGAGINVLGKDSISIYNNVVYNVGFNGSTYGQDGIFIDDRSKPGETPVTLFVANNTIVHTRRSGITFLNSYGNQNSNNKFYNNFVVEPGNYTYWSKAPEKAGVTIGSKTMVYTSLNNVVLQSIADAKFVNPASLNFQLTSVSPAYNKGYTLTKFPATTRDILGVIRPQNGSYDAGAYELVTSTTATSAASRQRADTAGTFAKTIVTKPGITLSPVPAKDNLNVYLNNAYRGKLQLKIVDANGKTLTAQNDLFKDAESWHTTLNVSQYLGGMYYIEVVTGNAKATEKFVIIK